MQGFIKQPKINGRQARWLVYLTPYNFIIQYRPGLLNPADRPLRRPDYIAMARQEPSLIQKDLFARRLVEEPNHLARGELYNTRPRLGKPDRPDILADHQERQLETSKPPNQAARFDLQEADEADSGLSKIGLHRDARIGQSIQEPLLPKAKETA